MNGFPSLPDYEIEWRSLLLEPMPGSCELISLGAIVKGSDGAVRAEKFLGTPKMRSLFGPGIANRIEQALSITLRSAETYFKENSIRSSWTPPVDGFTVAQPRASNVRDMEDGFIYVTQHSSIFSISQMFDIDTPKTPEAGMNAQTWRREIFKQIRLKGSFYSDYLDKEVRLVGSGVPFKFGFISSKYAAQFDAISSSSARTHDALIRAQSKLWQLDQLRDSNQLFKQDKYELVLYRPEDEDGIVGEFVDELRTEAARRQISLYEADRPEDAAAHIIKNAA